MKIAITGHRPNKLGNDYNLTSPLIKAIEDTILNIWNELEAKYLLAHPNELRCLVIFITGVALGIDTLLAQIAVNNDAPFIAAIPFKGQERMWPDKSKRLYHEYLKKALNIMIVDTNIRLKPIAGSGNNSPYEEYLKLPETSYNAAKMQQRNIWMVDQLDGPDDVLIAVFDGSTSGGTYNCVAYAKSKGKRIIHIDPKALILSNKEFKTQNESK